MSVGRTFDPRHLDVAAFALAGAQLRGAWPLSEMPRLTQDAQQGADPPADVQWAVRGERRLVAGDEDRVLLHLQVDASVQLVCQRCLQPVTVPVQVRTTLRFVRDESLAEKLDEDSEEDVMALSATLSLPELIEDELILALPVVPRHAACPRPLPMSSGASANEAAEQPFAGLASMLRDSRRGGKSD